MTTPAGWYPDPDGTGGQRYFNGESWTEHRNPGAAAAPMSAAVAAAPTAKKSGPDPKVLIGIGAAVVVLIGVVVAAVILTMNTKTGEDSVTHKPAEAIKTSAPASEFKEPDPTETQAAGVGQEVRDGNFSFVIAGVERVDAVADTEFPEIQKTAQGEFVIVKMTVTNVGPEPQTFFSSFNILSDGKTTFQPDDEAWIYLGNTLADLNPGDSIDTAVVFDVPKGTDVESIELHDGPFSHGVTVGL
jgi:hypothetical protein